MSAKKRESKRRESRRVLRLVSRASRPSHRASRPVRKSRGDAIPTRPPAGPSPLLAPVNSLYSQGKRRNAQKRSCIVILRDTREGHEEEKTRTNRPLCCDDYRRKRKGNELAACLGKPSPGGIDHLPLSLTSRHPPPRQNKKHNNNDNNKQTSDLRWRPSLTKQQKKKLKLYLAKRYPGSAHQLLSAVPPEDARHGQGDGSFLPLVPQAHLENARFRIVNVHRE